VPPVFALTWWTTLAAAGDISCIVGTDSVTSASIATIRKGQSLTDQYYRGAGGQSIERARTPPIPRRGIIEAAMRPYTGGTRDGYFADYERE
jgi:hypothetical protein